MLKHSHLFYYENENSYVSNEKELDVFWLKFCKISEVHAQSDKQFKLMIQDLRLDKLLVLTFDSGLTREDWLQAILAVQETILKGLIPVKTFGTNAKQQQEEALRVLAERQRDMQDQEVESSEYSDEHRCDMLTAFSDELDDEQGLNGYDYALVMPYEFGNKAKSWVEKRRASQREVVQALRREHLVCRILKSRDEDEVIPLSLAIPFAIILQTERETGFIHWYSVSNPRT